MKKPEFTFAVLAGSLCAAALFAAAPAMASGDEAGFIAEVRNNGAVYPLGGMISDGQLISNGYQACAQIKAGMSPEALANSKVSFYTDPHMMVAASQKYLCPDTL